jgi:hypothetical protein
MRVRLTLVILSALAFAMKGEKPYSFKTTPGRLPKQVVPLKYSIGIVPDPNKLTFSGSETVKIIHGRSSKRTEPISPFISDWSKKPPIKWNFALSSSDDWPRS